MMGRAGVSDSRSAAAALALTIGLAACGADGPPIPPSDDQREPGITISGRVGVGVTGGHATIRSSGNEDGAEGGGT